MKKATLTLAALLLGASLCACGSNTEDTAAVQSVSALCGYGPVGLAQRFSGVVSPRSQVEISKDYEKKIKECYVEAGDEVSEGQVLFTYDGESAEMDLQKAKLELEQMKNSLTTLGKQKDQLEKDRSKASADQKLSYTLEIQETEANIAETTYNIAVKEKEIGKQEESLKNLDVKASVGGIVLSVNEEGSTDEYGQEKPYIVISETGNYRIKGVINETNRDVLYEGTQVIIRSRVSEESWAGYISLIDWSNPIQNNNYYGNEDEQSQSSKYPFYVELDAIDGLLMGQHVYVEPDYGQDQESAAEVNLSEWYINDADTNPWVWAEGKNKKLEKRTLTLGDYNADMGTYAVLTGITLEDYIAVPDESLKEGMSCVEYDGAEGGSIEYEDGYDANDYMDDGSSFDEGVYDEGVYEEGVYDEGVYEEGVYEEDGYDAGAEEGYSEGEELRTEDMTDEGDAADGE